eukprot:scaffold55405_cov68-Phaeocystis_antarctica.AAC.2
MFIYTKITSVNTGELLERDRPDTNTVQTPAEPTGGVVGSLAGYSRVRIERLFFLHGSIGNRSEMEMA